MRKKVCERKETARRRYRALAIDLDGTLLNTRHLVGEEDRRAIGRLRASGAHLVVVTGRSIEELGPIEDFFPRPGDWAIVQGGSTIVRFEERDIVTEHRLMESSDRRKLARIARAHGFYPLVNVGSDIKSAPQENPWHARFEEVMAGIPVVYDERLDARLESLPVGKMVMMADPALLAEVEREMEEAGIEASWGISLPYGIDVCARSKREALLDVLAALDVTAQETVAIGDSDNDLEVIQLAGAGVAMGNATPRLQAAADFVTGDNDHGGVAQAIDRFFGETEVRP